jgi:hypothetical protein
MARSPGFDLCQKIAHSFETVGKKKGAVRSMESYQISNEYLQ